MKKFNYTAKNTSGDVLREEIESDSRQHALAELRRKGLTVVSLMEVEQTTPQKKSAVSKLCHKLHKHPKAAGADLTTPPKKKAGGRKIKLADMAVFCRQLAISVNSGLPLREALEGIHEDMDVPALKHVLANILKQLQNGVPFSKAVAP